MKKFITKTMFIAAILTTLCQQTFATSNTAYEAEVEVVHYDLVIETDIVAEELKISETTTIENGLLITTAVYELADGTIITDITTSSAVVQHSDYGSDSVTRELIIGNFATIELTGNFKWWKEGMTRIVQCTSASGKVLKKGSSTTQHQFRVEYSNKEVKWGYAYAQAKYNFYDTGVPVAGRSGTFYIRCSDEGTIKDYYKE